MAGELKTNHEVPPVRIVGEYTVATLPTASKWTRHIVYVSDGASGSPCLAISDGTNWKQIAIGATATT